MVHLCRDQQNIILQIADNELGFDPITIRGKQGRLGLAGRAERVALVGGQLIVNSRPERGTAVRVEVPL